MSIQIFYNLVFKYKHMKKFDWTYNCPDPPEPPEPDPPDDDDKDKK